MVISGFLDIYSVRCHFPTSRSNSYCSFAYSPWASFRMGISGSALFHSASPPIGKITTMCDLGHRLIVDFGGNCAWEQRGLPPKGGFMKKHLRCSFCGSVNQRKFIGDMSLRVPGLANIDTTPVVLAPEVYVCLDCCTAELVVPRAELRLLLQSDATCTDGLELCRGGCRDGDDASSWGTS